jgi:hypothetical protein
MLKSSPILKRNGAYLIREKNIRKKSIPKVSMF